MPLQSVAPIGPTLYSCRGNVKQKVRLGWQVRATVRTTCRNVIVTSRSCDVTSLFRHLLCDAVFTKTRLGRQALAARIKCILSH